MDNARSKLVPTDKRIGDLFYYFTRYYMWRSYELDGEAFPTNQLDLEMCLEILMNNSVLRGANIYKMSESGEHCFKKKRTFSADR